MEVGNPKREHPSLLSVKGAKNCALGQDRIDAVSRNDAGLFKDESSRKWAYSKSQEC